MCPNAEKQRSVYSWSRAAKNTSAFADAYLQFVDFSLNFVDFGKRFVIISLFTKRTLCCLEFFNSLITFLNARTCKQISYLLNLFCSYVTE